MMMMIMMVSINTGHRPCFAVNPKVTAVTVASCESPLIIVFLVAPCFAPLSSSVVQLWEKNPDMSQCAGEEQPGRRCTAGIPEGTRSAFCERHQDQDQDQGEGMILKSMRGGYLV